MRTTEEKIFFIFDLETNGLPYNSRMNYKFTNNWPGIVQIAWGIYNSNGDNLVFRNYIINNGGGLVTKNGHPNKESHQLWADYLEENIK